jgi:copper chaperone CopZ
MVDTISRWLRRAPVALGLAMLLLTGAGRAHAEATSGPLTRVRFQLRSECTCASCGFALRDQLHKLRGVSRVDLSPRDRTVTLTFDEGQVPLGRVAAVLAGTEIGKRSALIGDLAPAQTVPEAATLTHIEGIRRAEVDRKKGRLLLELSDGASLTTAGLSAALARAGIAVRLDAGSQTASLHH